MEEKKENSKKRFLEFLKEVGVSQNKCAAMCDWSTGYLNGLKGDFGADKLATIMGVFPHLNISWLISGKGRMFNPEAQDLKGGTESVISNEESSTISFEVFMQTTDRYNKIIAEKDAEIKNLMHRISMLENKE